MVTVGEEQMKIFTEVVQAMDDFIKETGGNLDPRGAYNRDRKALLQFFVKMSKLPRALAVEYMRHIIDQSITSLNLDGSTGFKQVDDLPKPLSPRFRVYNHLGVELQSAE